MHLEPGMEGGGGLGWSVVPGGVCSRVSNYFLRIVCKRQTCFTLTVEFYFRELYYTRGAKVSTIVFILEI